MAGSITIETVIYALIGGVVPAVLWLYFWKREDKDCPEPRSLSFLAFVGGMLVVPLVLPFQKLALTHLPAGIPVILAWATIEELFKYGIAVFLVLWRKSVNEPIDAIIYMITVALGFAALENTFFLLNPLASGNLIDSFVTGNLRFVGSTLLHVLASSMVGVALAFSFYRSKKFHVLSATIGLILAIALHTVFNILILDESGAQTLNAFLFVWVGVIILFFLFEVARWIGNRQKPRNKKNTCDT